MAPPTGRRPRRRSRRGRRPSRGGHEGAFVAGPVEGWPVNRWSAGRFRGNGSALGERTRTSRGVGHRDCEAALVDEAVVEAAEEDEVRRAPCGRRGASAGRGGREGSGWRRSRGTGSRGRGARGRGGWRSGSRGCGGPRRARRDSSSMVAGTSPPSQARRRSVSAETGVPSSSAAASVGESDVRSRSRWTTTSAFGASAVSVPVRAGQVRRDHLHQPVGRARAGGGFVERVLHGDRVPRRSTAWATNIGFVGGHDDLQLHQAAPQRAPPEGATLGHLQLGLARGAQAAADSFELGAGRRRRDLQHAVLALRCRDARDGADLGIREVASGEGRVDLRQRPQRTRDANLLARGPRVQPDPPRQPMRTTLRALLPPNLQPRRTAECASTDAWVARLTCVASAAISSPSSTESAMHDTELGSAAAIKKNTSITDIVANDRGGLSIAPVLRVVSVPGLRVCAGPSPGTYRCRPLPLARAR